MNLDDVLSAAGKHKRPRRVGRGNGSGCGKTSARGHGGARSRSGSRTLTRHEGGQNTALARMPKRGFSNAIFRKDYQIINIASLEQFDAETKVDAELLAKARLISDPAKPVKLLGEGQLTKKLTVAVTKASASAAKKVADAGGAIEQV